MSTFKDLKKMLETSDEKTGPLIGWIISLKSTIEYQKEMIEKLKYDLEQEKEKVRILTDES